MLHGHDMQPATASRDSSSSVDKVVMLSPAQRDDDDDRRVKAVDGRVASAVSAAAVINHRECTAGRLGVILRLANAAEGTASRISAQIGGPPQCDASAAERMRLRTADGDGIRGDTRGAIGEDVDGQDRNPLVQSVRLWMMAESAARKVSLSWVGSSSEVHVIDPDIPLSKDTKEVTGTHI